MNWFMRKSGKKWIYGCSVLVCGLLLGGFSGNILADEADTATVPVEQQVQTSTPESSDTELSQASIEESQTEVVDTDTTISENQATENETLVEPQTEAIQEAVAQTTDNQGLESDVVSKEEITESASNLISDNQSDSKADSKRLLSTNLTQVEQNNYHTNLEGLTYDPAVWQEREDGLYSNAIGKGDNFAYSTSTGKNFVFQTDVTFLQNSGAASLVFRSNNDANNLKGYVVNIDGNSHKAKLWRWAEANLIDEKTSHQALIINMLLKSLQQTVGFLIMSTVF